MIMKKRKGSSIVNIMLIFVVLTGIMVLGITLFNNNRMSISNQTKFQENELLAKSAVKIAKASLFANHSKLYKDFKKPSGKNIVLEESLDKNVFNNLADDVLVRIRLSKIDDLTNKNDKMIEIKADVLKNSEVQCTVLYYVATDKTKDDHFE